MFKPNALKKRLAAGDQVFGAWISSGDPTMTEVMGHAGFDFLILDLEHGQGELGELVHMLRAAGNTGTPCVVRVPWNDPVTLKRVLDAGADSVMIPMVEDAAQAAAAVRACLYPPHGGRGYSASSVRASAYGKVTDYMKIARDNLLLIVQIESKTATANAAAIAAVPGIDMVFIGVNDLAGSIGLLERLDHPDARALVAEGEAQIRASGRWMGTVPGAGAGWDELFDAGYNLVAGASDISLVRDAAADLVRARLARRNGDAATTGPRTKGGY